MITLIIDGKILTDYSPTPDTHIKTIHGDMLTSEKAEEITCVSCALWPPAEAGHLTD